jgi:peptidoglycan/xylan/chitin deacetylase (PgdA/CDA1 family)
VILCYHRVAELDCDPQLLAVTPEHFDEHLTSIASEYDSITLDELAAAERGSSRRPAVVITFDDGYADNLLCAAPMLERHDLMATVFVASGQVGSNREFWWDALESIFLQPGEIPETLEITIPNDRQRRFELSADAEYSEDSFRRHRTWTVVDGSLPTRRHQVYRDLCAVIRPLTPSARDSVLDDLFHWAGRCRTARSTRLALDHAQLQRLAISPRLSIGAHTVSHPVLSTLPDDEQRCEIACGKHELEVIVGGDVSHFAYPYGAVSDYTSRTIELVREAGFNTACTTTRAFADPGSSPFTLSRLVVRDCGGAELLKQISLIRT